MNSRLDGPSAEVEEVRLGRLARLNEEDEGWQARFAPGTFGHHELLDRVYWLARLAEEVILEHPACVLDPGSYAMADRALSILSELYQRVGAADPIESGEGSARSLTYEDFTLERACRDFSLTLVDDVDLRANRPAIEPDALLSEYLRESAPLGVAINTEKARSEFIVAPILAAVRRRSGRRVSLFSGIDFEVDPAKGLDGTCDFLMARSPIQLFVEAPVLAIVEAKKGDIKAGLGRCAAQMVAARLFNRRECRGPETIHGAVTTGSLWRFLKLEGSEILVDKTEYPLEPVGKILAILAYFVGEVA